MKHMNTKKRKCKEAKRREDEIEEEVEVLQDHLLNLVETCVKLW